MVLFTAHRFATSTQDNLKKYARDFKGGKDSNRRICAMGQCETDAEVEHALPNRRPKKTKKMPGELSDDTTISDADSKYEVQVHNVILGTIIESISRRFAKNRELYTDFAMLDPQNFNDLKCTQCPERKLIRHDSRATPEALQGELLSLATHWDKLKVSVRKEYLTKMRIEDGDDEQNPDEESDVVNKTCQSCRKCPICC